MSLVNESSHLFQLLILVTLSFSHTYYYPLSLPTSHTSLPSPSSTPPLLRLLPSLLFLIQCLTESRRTCGVSCSQQNRSSTSWGRRTRWRWTAPGPGRRRWRGRWVMCIHYVHVYSMTLKVTAAWDQGLLSQGWRTGHWQCTKLRRLGLIAVICEHKGNVIDYCTNSCTKVMVLKWYVHLKN